MSDAKVFPEFDTLRRQEAWLRPVVRALVADDATSDVLQETWIRAWQRPPRDPARADGWLRRVAVRFALTHRRAENRRRGREGDAVVGLGAATPSTAETVERLELQHSLSAAVTALAEPYRTTVLLRFYHGLSVVDVAARTNTTATNVRQRTHRALESLRGELERRHGSEWRRAPAIVAFLKFEPAIPPVASLPLVLSMTKLRVATIAIGGLCLIAAGALLVPWFLGGDVAAPNEPTAPVTAPLAAAPKAGAENTAREAAVPPPQRTEAERPQPASPTSRHPGLVLDERGQPVANAIVRTPAANDEWRPLGTSGVDGTFSGDATLPWDAKLVDTAPPWIPLAVQLPGVQQANVPLMLVVAPCREQVLLVRDETGLPIDGARAVVRVSGLVDFPRPLDDAVEMQFEPVVGNASGRHHWDRLPVAATAITVSKSGFRPATVAIEAATPAELPVVLQRIAKGQRLLTGTVLDGRGGYVRDATVGLGSRETKTDQFGSYAMTLEAGAFVDDGSVLFAVGDGWYPTSVPGFGRRVNARPEGTLSQDLLLDHPVLQIRGRVVDHEGRPQAGVAVYPWQLPTVAGRLSAEDLATGRAGKPLSLTGNLVHAFARTDGDGTFAVPGLDRRPYRLRVYDEREAWAWTSPEIEGGSENVELRLPVDLTGAVSGVVRDRAGRPAAGVDVAPYLEVYANGGGVASVGLANRAKTDAEGRFAFTRLARHAVSLTLGGREWVQRSVPIDAGTPSTDLQIVVMRRCHVRVQFTDAALASARVGFVDAEGETVMIQEDRGSTSMITSWYSLHDGKSEVLSVSEAATTMVVLSAGPGEKEQRFPITLQPGEVNLVAR